MADSRARLLNSGRQFGHFLPQAANLCRHRQDRILPPWRFSADPTQLLPAIRQKRPILAASRQILEKRARRNFPAPAGFRRQFHGTEPARSRRPEIAWLVFRREEVLGRLAAELHEGSWRPQGFRLVSVRDPKPRMIAVAPAEDRVVHTALVRLMEPAFLPSMIDGAFACRRGKGTHRAVLKLLELLRRHCFVLHLDIRSYFPSIDLEILHTLLAKRIHDPSFLEIVDRVLESGRGIYDSPAIRRQAGISLDWPPSGRGLPIGAYTSQLFAAQVYLCAFDHFVKRQLKAPGYVRYVDDLFLFGDRRSELRTWREECAGYLQSLRLPGGARTSPCARGAGCPGSWSRLRVHESAGYCSR